MTKELKLKIKKFLKTFIQWVTIIAGALIAVKVVSDALNPKKDKTVEDAKEVIEIQKLKIDVLEVKKEKIEEERAQIIADKKERDKKAKIYFGDL
jgi:hypothetical protein